MNTEPDVDHEDHELPADEAPREADTVPPELRPDDPPPDEGNADAERKEDTE